MPIEEKGKPKDEANESETKERKHSGQSSIEEQQTKFEVQVSAKNKEELDAARKKTVINMLILRADDLTKKGEKDKAKLLVRKVTELRKKTGDNFKKDLETLKHHIYIKSQQPIFTLFGGLKKNSEDYFTWRMLQAIGGNGRNVHDYSCRVLIKLIIDGITNAPKDRKDAVLCLANFKMKHRLEMLEKNAKAIEEAPVLNEPEKLGEEFELIEVEKNVKPIISRETVYKWDEEFASLLRGLNGDDYQYASKIRTTWEDAAMSERILENKLRGIMKTLGIKDEEPQRSTPSQSNRP